MKEKIRWDGMKEAKKKWKEKRIKMEIWFVCEKQKNKEMKMREKKMVFWKRKLKVNEKEKGTTKNWKRNMKEWNGGKTMVERKENSC